MRGIAGEVCIVTGADSEIGGACGVLLAESGGKVILSGSRERELSIVDSMIRDKGGSSAYLAGSSGREGHPSDILSFARETFGLPSVLINSPVFPISSSLHFAKDDDWNSLLIDGLTETYRLIRGIVPLMQERGGGSIVNVISIFAIRGRSDCSSALSALQGGILSLTRSTAVEYAPFDIRVNAILTGIIKTDEYRRLRAEKDPEFEKKLVRHIPLRRLGSPEEVASLAGFLASDFSSYITGASIPADGGYSVV